MPFGAPQNLLFLVAVPMVLLLMVNARNRRREAQARFAETRLFPAIAAQERGGFTELRLGLMGLATLLIALALAQPQGRIVTEEVYGEGIDIVLALDISKSMEVEDVYPSRLQVMKAIAKRVVDQNPQDRIGVVAFAGEAFVQCPLTLDHATVKVFLDALKPEPNIKQGTAIGEAIHASLERFDSSNGRVVVLFTDGESNKGRPPLPAAKLAAEQGVKIYTIGIGTDQGTYLTERSGFILGTPRPKTHEGKPVLVKLDSAQLTEIAKATGGTFLQLARQEDLNDVMVSLDRSARQEFSAGSRQVREELGPWFLGAAALLLWLDFFAELYRVSPFGLMQAQRRAAARTPSSPRSERPARPKRPTPREATS